ncbi:hypothetical protein [Paenisporosarcina sp.]|uniref:hypothetical protein n=1 Tax=Paenisporosarcina sp. TaxID=1932001 RepID=UPI003C76897A
MGYIFLAILIGVIIWTLWRLGTKRRLPLNHYQPFDDAMEGTKDDMKSSPLHDTKHETEYEETTSKKED